MKTLLSKDYVLEPVSVNDLQLASLAWGFTIGFGFLTTWTAMKQTAHMQRRYTLSKLNSPYIWMIWLEILVCVIFSVICWLHLNKIIPPSFAFYFVILTTWALQVQFLLQIIVNRVSLLLSDRQKAMRLKIGVAILITAVNISVYCIWVPARLQISKRYIYINDRWDRCEKTIYLCVDGALNWYFIHIVRKRLVDQGLVKYQRLVRFNMWIICFSLSMDVLIISMMSLKNSFVYMQFHPFAYIVKLNIEMSMADLIAKVSRSSTPRIDSSGVYSHAISQLASGPHDTNTHLTFPAPAKVASTTKYPFYSDVELNDIMYGKEFAPCADLKREVHVQVESVDSSATSVREGEREIGIALTEEDTRSLKHGGANQAWESKYGTVWSSGGCTD